MICIAFREFKHEIWVQTDSMSDPQPWWWGKLPQDIPVGAIDGNCQERAYSGATGPFQERIDIWFAAAARPRYVRM